MADDPDQLELGRAAFNRGDYFLAHELWEEVWREMVDAEQRRCVQGLIQIAAGLHHLQKRRARPAAGLLRKGLAKLSCERAGRCAHLPVDLLAGQVTLLLVELERSGTAAADLSQVKL